MHEYSIAYDIYATARRAALENRADHVTRVHVDVGELAMVNPEQVRFLFEVIIEEDPLFQGAKLACRHIEARVQCPCGYEGAEKYVCPRCGRLPDIVAGREIMVTNIEIEVNES
ncbi:MAG: hydrogenase maturation nickel metallochaperone HypA [Methanomicrobiaceae archaeon]|uniref:Hydrogenase nickel incorporation protein hypa n=1 Tax=hydrocarbon metagenome TaxID=938273 RepID=A0A0W8FGZ9_9ZZZZ|nr:hydrogenase maturation nickel metallochaperone HypA [Methanomicrobiaceae archaeon]MDD5419664.1 hydrogenase maturation nickel metallochaperone HypA [Methanomicrobiaceae archaeon]